MTYEEILAEADANTSGAANGGLGQIIDATGATVRLSPFAPLLFRCNLNYIVMFPFSHGRYPRFPTSPLEHGYRRPKPRIYQKYDTIFVSSSLLLNRI